ncbi:MAG: SnoaL-like protein [Ignavibacteria bacterium]|nr:SnoaL-like protein [Ignavibacteria bacterium]
MDLNLIKKEIETEVINICDYYHDKNFEALSRLFSTKSNIMIFGTNSKETYRTIEEWQALVKRDIELYDVINFGKIRNLSIQVASSANFATSFFEAELEYTAEYERSNPDIRLALTWIKEDENWKIIQWLASFPATEEQQIIF